MQGHFPNCDLLIIISCQLSRMLWPATSEKCTVSLLWSCGTGLSFLCQSLVSVVSSFDTAFCSWNLSIQVSSCFHVFISGKLPSTYLHNISSRISPGSQPPPIACQYCKPCSTLHYIFRILVQNTMTREISSNMNILQEIKS